MWFEFALTIITIEMLCRCKIIVAEAVQSVCWIARALQAGRGLIRLLFFGGFCVVFFFLLFFFATNLFSFLPVFLLCPVSRTPPPALALQGCPTSQPSLEETRMPEAEEFVSVVISHRDIWKTRQTEGQWGVSLRKRQVMKLWSCYLDSTCSENKQHFFPHTSFKLGEKIKLKPNPSALSKSEHLPASLTGIGFFSQVFICKDQTSYFL